MRIIIAAGVLAVVGALAVYARQAAPVPDAFAASSQAAQRSGAESRPEAAPAQGAAAATAGASASPAEVAPAPGASTPATAPSGEMTAAATAATAAGAARRATADRARKADGTAAPAQASAEALLERAAAAYRRIRSMSASFVQVVRNPLLASTTTSRGTMYERRPDRFLMRFSQPAGDQLVSDGRYFWVYYPSVDPKQVVRMPAASGGGGVDLQAQFLGDPGQRFNARLQGRVAVAGRPANVLHLVPRTPQSYKEMTVWLDARDNLARRFEIIEQNGTVRRVDLSNLRVNVPVAESLFHFTPPSGAHVVAR